MTHDITAYISSLITCLQQAMCLAKITKTEGDSGSIWPLPLFNGETEAQTDVQERCPKSQEEPSSKLVRGFLSPGCCLCLCPGRSDSALCLFLRARAASSFNFLQKQNY